jgi:type II secretory ATPase GspE/PulE/Tfp pilus assembly ATPase PilB-like protein
MSTRPSTGHSWITSPPPAHRAGTRPAGRSDPTDGGADAARGSRDATRDEARVAGDVIRLVERLVGAAAAARASDVHLEAADDALHVRHRVDGVMRDVERLPSALGLPLVSRVKILAGLDIADRLRPQDGRARVAVAGGAIDVRVSTLPAARGESVVLRLQPGDAALPTLDALGFATADRARVERLLDAREGLVLVTGPTGSGKTTTLYAALGRLRSRGGVNVVTVEDPVERRVPGVVQVQVHERTGLTFATALRAILRQDPDVVLVGEIRDRETASIAAQAALTGHLVLATLHTIDAASAVTRLTDVGVEPFQVAAALRGVIAQRLVRRRCARCGGGEATGCVTCHGAGFHGRSAVVEVLLADAPVRRRIARGGGPQAVARAARARGMATLWESGLSQVRAGVTTLDELRRVLDPPGEDDAPGGPGRSVHPPPGPVPSRVAEGRPPPASPPGPPPGPARPASPGAPRLPHLDEQFDVLLP